MLSLIAARTKGMPATRPGIAGIVWRDVAHTQRVLGSLLLVVLLGACTATPGIPETTWFRLPAAASVPPLPAPVIERAVVVEPLRADGVHSDQALLYALDPAGTQLRAYHYHLWVQPPARMLQRRLMQLLREANVSHMVVDRMPPRSEAVRIGGRIERFERVPAANGWGVAVALTLRADAARSEAPLLVRRYSAELPAASDDLAGSVQAFGTAVDQIYAEFLRDLTALQ